MTYENLLSIVYTELLNYSYKHTSQEYAVDILHDALIYFHDKYYDNKKNMSDTELKIEILRLVKDAISKGFNSSTSPFNRKYIKLSKDIFYKNNYENFLFNEINDEDVEYDETIIDYIFDDYNDIEDKIEFELKLKLIMDALNNLKDETKSDKELFKQYWFNNFTYREMENFNDKSYSTIYNTVKRIELKIKKELNI